MGHRVVAPRNGAPCVCAVLGDVLAHFLQYCFRFSTNEATRKTRVPRSGLLEFMYTPLWKASILEKGRVNSFSKIDSYR